MSAVYWMKGTGITVLVAGIFGAVIGILSILSQIAADALTPMGVTPFASVNNRHYTLDLVRASNDIANNVLLIMGVTAGGLILVLSELL